jgi:drug/metabolite transporter (DMT)-like permease
MGSTEIKKHPLSNPALASALAALCAVIWGASYPAIKLGYEFFAIEPHETAEKFLFAGIRFTAAGAVVILLAALKYLRLKSKGRGTAEFDLKPGDLPRITGLGLLHTAGQYLFFYIGLGYVSGAKGSIINATSVFFSALIVHFLHADDRITPRKALGIAVGFAGVIAVNFSSDLGFDFSFQGEGFVAIAALLLSAGSIYGRTLTKRLNSGIVAGGNFLAGGLALLIGGLAGDARFGSPAAPAYVVLAFLVASSAFTGTLWAALLTHNRVSSITVYNFIIPFSGALLSAVFLGDSVFELRYGLALPAVCAGVYLVNMRGRRCT